MYYYNAALVRPQLKLTDVWMKMTQAYATDKITKTQFNGLVAKLGDPIKLEFIDPATNAKQTFTEDFAKSINNKIGSDSTYQTKIRDAILKASEAQYDAIGAELKGLTG
jgi:hypothetical protein